MESLEGGAHHGCIKGADGSGGQEGRPDIQAGHCKDIPDEWILRGVLRAPPPRTPPWPPVKPWFRMRAGA